MVHSGSRIRLVLPVARLTEGLCGSWLGGPWLSRCETGLGLATPRRHDDPDAPHGDRIHRDLRHGRSAGSHPHCPANPRSGGPGPGLRIGGGVPRRLGRLVVAFGASFVWAKGPILLAGGILSAAVGGRARSRGRPRSCVGRPGPGATSARPPVALPATGAPSPSSCGPSRAWRRTRASSARSGIDDALYRMDLRLFGVEPTVWAGRFVTRC